MHYPSQLSRILTGSALALCCVLTLHAESRTYTSPDGRTLQAEILSAESNTVTLKLTTGQTLTAAVDKFSQADQAFIKEWQKANPVTIKYNFNATYTKEKTDSSKVNRDNHEVVTDTWVCNVKLLNRSGQDLEKVRVDYEIYYEQMSSGKPVMRRMNGSSTLDSIKHLEELTLPTKELKLTTSKLDGGRYYVDGSRPRQKDSISGVALKIYHSGKPAFEWASSGVPKDRAQGDEKK